MLSFMFWRKVESSAIKRMTWHPLGGGTMAVTFTKGTVYRYNGVPLAVYRGLVATSQDGESLGSAFHWEIKRGGYEYQQVA